MDRVDRIQRRTPALGHWDELAVLLTESYCLQAPAALAERVSRPG